ncbi:MAG: lamin tail domain-containing protein, partial [Deltaproteobacteria bacterium]|nr:lamin tail domain-containing protein [Deltaproteobacteria bacterium]
QADDDNDDKGNVCDPCPSVPNAGSLACPATIYAIKQGSVGGDVAVEDALVTGCSDGNGYFLQVKAGDADYVGPDHSGIFVYHGGVVCSGGAADVEVGDRVTLNPATVSVFYDQIQLNNAAINVLSSGESAPTPVTVTAAAAAGSAPTTLEAVLVKVDNVVVTDINPAAGPGDAAPTNEFVVDNVLVVNDLLHLTSPFPTVNTPYTSITGILDFRNGDQKLEVRDQADLEAGTPILIGFEPPLSYARQGVNGAATIPAPLTVGLSGPALTNTFVTIGSSAPGSLVAAGGGVTIPQGSATAPVLVNALQQAQAVTLTASLNSVNLMADVRVVGTGEQPQVVSIDPPMVTVAPQTTAPFTVYLNIPAANPGGNTVNLSFNPGTFGSVPATVAVTADQISAGFSFTAGTQEGNELLTALLNGSATATIDVMSGSGLVINEVDYDNVGTDSDEFIEILNTTGAPISLANLAVVFVNGNGDTEYKRVDLSTEGSLAGGQYLVVGSPTLVNSVPGAAKAIAFGPATNNIQNGAPDAVAILDVSQAILLDALSYEGSVTVGNINGVGPTNFVEGTATQVLDTNSSVRSLIRNPNGSDTDDAATDWAYSSTPSPGEVNQP